MIILAIDPGTQKRNPAGLVVIDFGPPDGKPELLHASTVYGVGWEEAARNVANTALQLYFAYLVNAIAYEYPFVGEFETQGGETTTNPQTAIKLAHFGGVAMACGAFINVPVIGVYPVQAKAALTRYSDANKAAMIQAARLIFGRQLSSHEADACGVAMAAEGKLKEQALIGRAM